jgi:hypothetical protein
VGPFLFLWSGFEPSLPLENVGSTNRQESRFGRRPGRRPEGEGHGWPESIPPFDQSLLLRGGFLFGVGVRTFITIRKCGFDHEAAGRETGSASDPIPMHIEVRVPREAGCRERPPSTTAPCVAFGSGFLLRSTSSFPGLVPPASMQSSPPSLKESLSITKQGEFDK